MTDPVRPARSPLVRLGLLAVGHLSLGLGVLGIFLPVLPTAPLMLLAAACYARASRRFYERLVAHPAAGPVILEWRQHGTIPRRAKRLALVTIALTFGISIGFVVEGALPRVLLAALGLGIAAYLWRLPTGPADR